jgi:cobalt/nickel transport system permease protein
MDTAAQGSTFVHRLDGRAKILVTFLFVVTVMSFGPYRIGALVPFFLFPAIMISAGGVPVRYLLIRLMFASPFVILVGILNPFIDRTPVMVGAGMAIGGGWISFLSIIIRCSLTVTAALTVLYTTGMYRLCQALERMGVPPVMVTQLLFLYRYLFVLADEAARMLRARECRNVSGALFTRTLERADHIHQAMVSRGFTGEIVLAVPAKLSWKDAAFLIFWTGVFVFMRIVDVPVAVGNVLGTVLS